MNIVYFYFVVHFIYGLIINLPNTTPMTNHDRSMGILFYIKIHLQGAASTVVYVLEGLLLSFDIGRVTKLSIHFYKIMFMI